MSGASRPDQPAGIWGVLRHFFCSIIAALASLLRYLFNIITIIMIKLGCQLLTWPVPVKPGETIPARTIDIDNLTARLRDAMRPDVTEGDGNVKNSEVILWQLADSEVLFYPQTTQIKITDGLILIGLTLESDQTGKVVVSVPFAIGSADKSAGMIAVTEEQPRGPETLIELWGEAVIATAWNALLETVQRMAAEAGRDQQGNVLRAGALVARRDKLIVVPQAMHNFESALISQNNKLQTNL